MVGKPHRQNSLFQLKFFLAGSCSTADGAYILMHGQLVDMRDKVNSAESQLKRREAKLAKAQYVIDCPKSLRHEVLEAEADKLETLSSVETWETNLRAAKQELADIVAIMDELRPQCKYYDADILIHAERAQSDEWLGELKKRAENFLLTAGTIPHDHFDTMRMHPKFREILVPHITEISARIAANPVQKVMLGLDQPALQITHGGANG